MLDLKQFYSRNFFKVVILAPKKKNFKIVL